MHRLMLILVKDSAFLDRVDVKYQIPEPCAQARYEILRLSYLELIEANIIWIPQSQALEQQGPDVTDDLTLDSTSSINSQSHNQSTLLLPRYGSMKLHFWSDEQSVAKSLWNLAERSKVRVQLSHLIQFAEQFRTLAVGLYGVYRPSHLPCTRTKILVRYTTPSMPYHEAWKMRPKWRLPKRSRSHSNETASNTSSNATNQYWTSQIIHKI